MEIPDGIQSEDDLPAPPMESPRAALNLIAEVWPEGTLEPDNINLSLATKICLEIESDVGDLIETVETETNLSHREAQVCILRKMAREGGGPLSDKAITLYLILVDDADDYISPQAIQSYHSRVGEKVTDAKQTLLHVLYLNHDMVFDDPDALWLENDTIRRVKSRAENRNVSVSTVIEQSLDDTERQLELRELVAFYRDEFDAAQVAIEKQSVEMGQPSIVVHTGNPPEETPEKVSRADVISLDEDTFPFHIQHSAMEPQRAFRVTLFASDKIRGMDPVSVDEGINNLRKTLLRSRE